MANTTMETASVFDAMHDEPHLLEKLNSAEVKRLIPAIVFLMIICFVGIIGNSVVIYVYIIKYRMSNTKCFILCLSTVDLLTCCIAIPLDVATTLEQYTFEHLWTCKISRVSSTLGIISSAFILLFIAVDRYRKVCKPFDWQIKIRVAKLLCGLAIFLGIMVSWPAIFIYGKKAVDIPEYNVTGTECSTADEVLTTTLPFIYSVVLGLLFVGGMLEMSVIYCFIGLKIRRQTRKMHDLRSRKTSMPMTSSGSEAQDTKFESGLVTETQENDEITNNQINLQNQKLSEKKVKQGMDNSEPSYTNNVESQKKEKIKKRRLNDGKGNEDFNEKETECFNMKIQVEEEAIKREISDISNITNKEESASKMPLERTFLEDAASLSLKDRMTQFPNKFIRRLSAISNRITGISSRMASITSPNMDADRRVARTKRFSKQAQARKTTLIMFIITFSFIVSFLPHLVLMLARQISSHLIDDLSETGRAVYKFSLRSFFLNSALNPILYSIFDSKFKLACKQVLERYRRQTRL